MSKPQRFLGYGRQTIAPEDIDAVLSVLQGDFLTQGPKVQEFEEALAAYCNVKHAIAVSSGTAALHLAVLAAGVERGTWGITQPLTFVASANCMLYEGMAVDFVDVDPDTLMLSPRSLQEKLRAGQPDGAETSMIIPVAFAGLSSRMQEIRAVAGHRVVIEDACHALGGRDENGQPVGSCANADMTVFSFHPVKPLTTAEGGAITTNDDTLAYRLRLLRTHGITRESCINRQAAKAPWYYEQQMLGYNYRMSDLQAALGLSQLRRLDKFLARRQEIVARYDSAFRNCPRIALHQASAEQRRRSGHHLYVISLDFDKIGISRAEAMHWLRQRNIGTQVHYIPVHHQPYHAALLRQRGVVISAPATEAFYAQCLSLPCFPGMSDAEVEWVADQVLQLASGRLED